MHLNRPNILVILTEDLSPHSTSYGDALSPLKSIDAIADGALVFENAFCTAPVCSPSRFSLITGIEPASNSPAQHHGADSVIPEGIKLITDPLKELGYYCTNYSKADYNFVANMPEMWDDFSLEAHWRNRSDGQPFFAFFNFVETHESSIFHEFVTEVKPDQIELPPYLPDTLEIRNDFAKYYTAMAKSEAKISKLLSQLEEDELTKNTVIIQISDHGGSTPRTKRFVYDSGNKVPLIIKVPRELRDIYREPVRIKTAVSLIDFAPTVLAIAGAEKPKTMTGSSLLDRASGDEEHIVFTGRDRMDEVYDLSRTARSARFLYIRNYFPNRPWLQYQSFAWQAEGYQSWETEYRAGRTNELQSRYWMEKPAEEFYDNEADPHQVNNLISSPELKSEIEKYREALDQRTLRIYDNGFIPEGLAMEGLVNSRNSEIYPLNEILELANLAIKRDSENIGHFVNRLSHTNEVIRFWAAQGLLMLGESAAPASESILDALGDSCEHVRVTAGELAFILGYRREAVELFKRTLVINSSAQVLIRALKGLVLLNPVPTELMTTVNKLMEDSEESMEVEYRNVYNAAAYFVAWVGGTHEPRKLIFDDEKFKKWLAKRFGGSLGIK